MSLQQQHHADYHDEFMLEALKEAKHALDTFEVPVGCVFVDPKTNTIIARGHNLTNLRKNALEHAELVAIGKFEEEKSDNNNNNSNNFRIKGSHLYVTVEPCIMCASALLYHGVGKVFFGCRNPRFGGNGTILSLHDDHVGELWSKNNHDDCNNTSSENGNNNNNIKIGYESFAGFREQEAIKLLQDFYEQENPSAPQPRVKRRARKEDDGDREE